MPSFLPHPHGNTVKLTAAHTVGHAMTTTSVGHCWLKILLFIFEADSCLRKKKITPSSTPTMFQMGLIAAVLAS